MTEFAGDELCDLFINRPVCATHPLAIMATLDVLERGAAGPGAVRIRNQANPYSDNVLLSLANVRAQDEETRLRPTLFGPALAPASVPGAIKHDDVAPPQEAKPISPHVVNDWVSRCKNVSFIHTRCIVCLSVERMSHFSIFAV